MPIEHLWQWLREDVTYHTCDEDDEDLIEQIKLFELCLNDKLHLIVDRLWVVTHLQP